MKIQFNEDGFEQIRRSDKVARAVESLATRVASQAGSGYEWDSQQGNPGPAPAWNKHRGPGFQGRFRAIVYPKSWRAIHDNGRNNTLAKLAGGGF